MKKRTTKTTRHCGRRATQSGAMKKVATGLTALAMTIRRGTAFAVAAAFACVMLPAACTKDDGHGGAAAGTAPVEITAATVGDLVATRALDETTGFNGPVKEKFVEDDEISLGVQTPDGGTLLSLVVYKYNSGAWKFAHGRDMTTSEELSTLYLPVDGKFRLVADYYVAESTEDGIHTFGDWVSLLTTPDDGSGMLTYSAAEGKWSLSLKFAHMNSLLRMTVVDGTLPGFPALDGIESVKALVAHVSGDHTVAVKQWSDTDAEENAIIVPEGAALRSVTVVMESGQEFTATVGGTTGVTVEGGMAYDVEVVTYEAAAEVTLSAPSDSWAWDLNNVLEPIVPEGYDRVIYDEASLRAFAAEVNAADGSGLSLRAIQMANITLTDNDPDAPNMPASGGGNWVPMGKTQSFQGVYNGNGYEVQGLRVEGSYTYAGFFGYVRDAVLAGIHLTGAYVENSLTSSAYTGTLAGYAYASAAGKCVIALCSGTGTVKGGSSPGGLVGELFRGAHLTRSRAAVAVSSGSWHAGGLVGRTQSGAAIVGCSAAGNASADHSTTENSAYVGGLVGSNEGGSTIAFCYAAGDASAAASTAYNEFAGGLVGDNYSSIRYSYATGTARGAKAGFSGPCIGSFVGLNRISCTVEYSHALIATTGGQNTKFIGGAGGTVTGDSQVAGAAALTVGATATAPDDGNGGTATLPFTATAYTVEYDKDATGPTKYKALEAWTGGGNTPTPRTFKSYAADGKNCIWTLAPGSTLPVINYGYNGEVIP